MATDYLDGWYEYCDLRDDDKPSYYLKLINKMTEESMTVDVIWFSVKNKSFTVQETSYVIFINWVYMRKLRKCNLNEETIRILYGV